jgi:hypothetical protein
VCVLAGVVGKNVAGVWVQSQLAAPDMLHRIKGIFGADHVPVVSSGHSGFFHHQKLRKKLDNWELRGRI